MTSNQSYFVRGEDGQEYGPVELSELRDWAGEKRVGLGTVVRLDEPRELWHPWQYFPELVALLAEVSVTGVPVVAPWLRRLLAAFLDLVLCGFLMIPPMFVAFVLLPPEIIASLNHVTEQMMAGVTPVTAPTLIFPPWFMLTWYAIYFGMPTLYYTGFLAAHGRTPAKSIVQIKVVDRHGRKPMFSRALLRTIVFILTLFISLFAVLGGVFSAFYALPLFYVFINPQRRALHDIIAGTYVVER